MLNQQDARDDDLFAPLSTCKRILTTLWQRASEGSSRPAIVFEEWVHEVGSLAKLAEWKGDFKQKLRDGANLWLPGEDPQELGVLLAVANVADELGCTASQLAEAFTELPLGNLKQPVAAGSSSSPPSPVNQSEARRSLAVDAAIDYQPLIEALNDWQAMFELALDEAAARLGHEEFPAKDLSASLAEMCELLRDVLPRNGEPYKNQQRGAI